MNGASAVSAEDAGAPEGSLRRQAPRPPGPGTGSPGPSSPTPAWGGERAAPPVGGWTACFLAPLPGRTRPARSAASRTTATSRSIPCDRFLVDGGGMPFGPRLSCFAPSPGGPGLGPWGPRSLSRAPLRPPAASSAAGLRNRRRGEAGHGPRAGGTRGHRAKARPARAGHRRLRTSPAFAGGGGSSYQMSSPGITMPSTRLPSARA